MTMRELAMLANVSLSTVSKAFSDAEELSVETRKHIFKLTKKNGRYENFYKGTYPQKIIGIICPELESSYYISFVMVLKKFIESNNCIPIISTDRFSSTVQEELLDHFAYRVIKQLRKLCFRVPNDFSVVGIDNINAFQYMETPLSSISTNPEEVCMIAWDLMERKIKTPRLVLGVFYCLFRL